MLVRQMLKTKGRWTGYWWAKEQELLEKKVVDCQESVEEVSSRPQVGDTGLEQEKGENI